jgi:hypothetical protein
VTIVIRKRPAVPRRRTGGFVMARSGRKRKIGPRHPGGQLKKKKQPIDDKVRASRQPHRRALMPFLREQKLEVPEVQKAIAGEEAESPIGRLWLAGALALSDDADSQAARDRYDAGNRFAQVVGEYRSVIETPRDVAGSGRGYACDPPLCRVYPDDCQCLKRRRRYMEAYEALAGGLRRAAVDLEHGIDIPEPLRDAILEAKRLKEDEEFTPAAAARRRVLMAVVRVAVHREAITGQDLVYLVQGLEQLRRHFGLTPRHRRPQYRNAN